MACNYLIHQAALCCSNYLEISIYFQLQPRASQSHNNFTHILKVKKKVLFSYIHSNLDLTNKSVRPFLFTISNNSLYVICNVPNKSSKWELGFVHYITKFTISRFVILRFECISNDLGIFLAREGLQ